MSVADGCVAWTGPPARVHVRVAVRPKKLPPRIIALAGTRTWTSRLHFTGYTNGLRSC